jgi:general secretion pathway protein J
MTYPRYHPPDIDDEAEIFRVNGTQDFIDAQTFSRLRFTTMAHLRLNQDPYSGIAQVVYYVQEEPDRGLVLKRADHLFPYPEFEPAAGDPVLCENVQAFEMTFFSADGQDYPEWDSESDDVNYSTPRSIAVRLAVGDADAPYVFTTEVALPVYRFKEKNE